MVKTLKCQHHLMTSVIGRDTTTKGEVNKAESTDDGFWSRCGASACVPSVASGGIINSQALDA